MSETSRLTPEARRKDLAEADKGHAPAPDNLKEEDLPHQVKTIIQRVALGVYDEGFIFAGNFAYLSLLAVFAFFIVAAAIAGSFGQTAVGADIVETFLSTVPPSVAAALRQPIGDAMTARTGPLLWFSAVVGLWTATSLMEAIREILHRAYGVVAQRAFWEYRLTSIAVIILSIFFAMLALSAQFLFSAVEEFLVSYFPQMETHAFWVWLTGVVPFLILFVTLYLLFRLLTPREYRPRHFPKWPGAVIISIWWLTITGALPIFLKYAAGFQLTYGSLAGVMITLIFFYLVGLGMVTGAQLNAALAEFRRKPEDTSS